MYLVTSQATQQNHQQGLKSRREETPKSSADGSRPVHYMLPSLCHTHLTRIGAARVLVVMRAFIEFHMGFQGLGWFRFQGLGILIRLYRYIQTYVCTYIQKHLFICLSICTYLLHTHIHVYIYIYTHNM